MTADTEDVSAELIDPRAQLRLLAELGTLIGPETFADSLVYSTSRGNTGWTAFRMGRLGHTTYHHWDVARPALLQLDLYAIGALDDQRGCGAINEHWRPTGSRQVIVQRGEPSADFASQIVRDDLLPRGGKQVGLGPGDHLHLLVDQTGGLRRRPLKSPELDQALMQLVDLLSMRAMTPIMRHDRIDNDSLAYDAIVGITTSHISMRLRQSFDRVDISLDVFSCRKFEVRTVLDWLDRLLPTPVARRAILYNRFPKNEFTVIS